MCEILIQAEEIAAPILYSRLQQVIIIVYDDCRSFLAFLCLSLLGDYYLPFLYDPKSSDIVPSPSMTCQF